MQETEERQLCSRIRKIPWRTKWQPTPVFLPREFHAQRSLVDCSPWGHKELNVTEGLIEGDREKKRKREKGSGAQDWN